MYLTGRVDERTLEKHAREAEENGRASWFFARVLDTNEEERDRGKTVEVGRAYFETEKKHFTILDAPGHKYLVSNMIIGTSQADLAILVISARRGEFETGFEKGGQTREHALLAKANGVKFLIVLINKMDDPTVGWSEERFNECRDKLLPYLKNLGFNPNKDLTFIPCSGLTGAGLNIPIDQSVCPWYKGSPLIPFLDDLPTFQRINGPFILPIVGAYKDKGTIIIGKVERGQAMKGQSLVLMPNGVPVTLDQIWMDDALEATVAVAGSGECVSLKLKGVESEDVGQGFVLCEQLNPCTNARVFDAQVVILEHNRIISAGYSAVIHIHCATEDVSVRALLCTIDKRTGEKLDRRPRFVRQKQMVIMRLECAGVIYMEPYRTLPQLGRFTLRDEDQTIAFGKVLKIIE